MQQNVQARSHSYYFEWENDEFLTLKLPELSILGTIEFSYKIFGSLRVKCFKQSVMELVVASTCVCSGQVHSSGSDQPV